MNRSLSIILSIVLLVAVPAIALGDVIYGCYKENQGQLRIVSDPSECIPPEIPISWSSEVLPWVDSLNLYVDKSIGQDLEGFGLSPETPFKTIGFSLSSAPKLRKSSDVPTTINVAAGTYNEHIVVDKDNIHLKGQSGVILDGAEQDVVVIDGAQNVSISDISVTNGLDGIKGVNGSSFKITNAKIETAKDDAIQIMSSSSALITDTIIENCIGNGIELYGSSSAILNGAIELSKNSNGIYVNGSSDAVFYNAVLNCVNNSGTGILSVNGSHIAFVESSITVSENAYNGIGMSNSSSALFLNTTFTASNNGNTGMSVFGSSSASLYNSVFNAANNSGRGIVSSSDCNIYFDESTITASDNGNDGIGCYQSSNINIGNGSSIITKNNLRRGVAIATSSNLFIANGCELLSQNNSYIGLHLAIGASAEIDGKLTLDKNKHYGIDIAYGSAITVDQSASVEIRGTTGDGFGLLVNEVSSYCQWGGSLVIENNYSFGAMAYNSSQIRLFKSSKNNAFYSQIRNNGADGVAIIRQSSAELKDGVTILGNGDNGVSVRLNSTLSCRDIQITDNNGQGIFAEDGSGIDVSDSSITGNSAEDVSLSFGARSTLNSNTIDDLPITCDGTVLSRGDTVCP